VRTNRATRLLLDGLGLTWVNACNSPISSFNAALTVEGTKNRSVNEKGKCDVRQGSELPILCRLKVGSLSNAFETMMTS
jgi:hypothetical protein